MCLDPVTLTALSLAASAGSAVVGYVGQKQSADAQADSIREQNRLQQADMARQRDQIDAATRAQMNEASRAALRDQALFEVVTGEFGGGRSAQRAGAVADVQRGEGLATIATNRDNAQTENRMQSLATASAANARLASIQQPSLIETGLRIGGAALDYGRARNASTRPIK